MSEKPPSPERDSNSLPAEHPTEEQVAHTAEKNTVPPTPESPAEAIAETQERLAGQGEPAKDSDSNEKTNTPKKAESAAAGGHHHESKITGFFKGAWGIFAFFWVHIVWQGIKRANEMMGGGGGGGHKKKDDHGGGGHGH